MKYAELLMAVNELNQSLENTIEMIEKLIDVMLSSDINIHELQSITEVYHGAIQSLVQVIKVNQECFERVEELMRCDEQLSEQPLFESRRQKNGSKTKDNNDETSGDFRTVEERRRALSEALRAGQPLTSMDTNGFKPVDKAVIADSDQSTAEAIVALRSALADGGELSVNQDGTLLRSVLAIGEVENPDAIEVPSGKLVGGTMRCCLACGKWIDCLPHVRYCSCCGNKIDYDQFEKHTDLDVNLSKVEFSAIAPKALVKGDYTVINIIMYEKSSRYIVDEIINSTDEPVQEIKSGVQKVSEGSNIKIILSSPDISIEDNIETGVWNGEYLYFSFAVFLPAKYKKRQILFTATVYINDVIATKIKFIVKCFSFLEQKISVSREDICSAFVSYASQDRNRVAAIIQGMKKARPDMDVFFDVESLRSGEDWERALHQEIEKRDILFLCWSRFAQESKWVDEEWRYAFEHKGVDCIEPVPIEPPDICPPPEELKHKHFNDKLLFIINATENNK